ncbi:MAG: hypothetical protein Q4P28_02830 [Tissierellia bacterium]|nr:hypothetical protein [Tissierellia bacterium]
MSKKLFRTEFKRQLFSYKTLIPIVIGILLIVYQQFFETQSFDSNAFNLLAEYTNSPPIYVYLFILPILIPYLASNIYEEDRKWGIYPLVNNRVLFKEYLFVGALISFIFGAIFCVLPLIMQQISAFMTLPAKIYEYPFEPIIYRHGIYRELFTKHPFLHLSISNLRFLLFGGVIALFAYGISLHSNAIGRHIIMTFVIFFILFAIEFMSILPTLSQISYLKISIDDARYYGDPRIPMYIELIILFGISIYLIRKKVNDEIL